MKGKRVSRDDPSDVFSLGCVFLEMATLLLGRNLNDFAEYYTSTVNGAKEEAYYCNLPRVYKWIEDLRHSSIAKPVQVEPLASARIRGQDFGSDLDRKIADALAYIREMLDENPETRPKSKGLWKCFQAINSERCRDCDPRYTERWRPSER